MKIPNFASSYQDGSGLESSDFQVASYLACTQENWLTNKSNVATKVNMLQPEKYKSEFEEHRNKVRANKLITRLTSENKRFNNYAPIMSSPRGEGSGNPREFNLPVVHIPRVGILT